MRRLLLLAPLVSVTTLGSAARAQDATEQAARTFRAASDAYVHGDFATAARDFEAAYRMAPRGAAAYNAGLAREGAGEPARAADDYATAVAAPDTRPEQRADAASRLRSLEARLARLAVGGPLDARVSVDGAPDAALPLTLHLAPGRHALRASYADGRAESRAFEASAGEEVGVRLGEASEPTPPAQAQVPAPPPPRTQPPLPPERSDLEPERPRRLHRTEGPVDDAGAGTRRSLAWVSLGGALVASSAAVLFYETGLSARDRFVSTGATDTGLHDQAANLRTLAQVSWGVAAALGAGAVVLFLTSRPASSGTAALQVTSRGVDLRVRF